MEISELSLDFKDVASRINLKKIIDQYLREELGYDDGVTIILGKYQVLVRLNGPPIEVVSKSLFEQKLGQSVLMAIISSSEDELFTS